MIVPILRTLTIAAHYLGERDAHRAVAMVYRYLLRWVSDGRIAGVSRLPLGTEAIVRRIPFGLASPADPEFAYRLGMTSASMVEEGERNLRAAGLMCSLIAKLTNGRDLTTSLEEETCANRTGMNASVLFYLRRALSLTPGVSRVPRPNLTEVTPHEGILLWALGSILAYPSSFREAVLDAVSHGDCPNAAGSIAGALLGAVLGDRGIPDDWLDELQCRSEVVAVTTSMYRTFRGRH